MSSTIDYKGSTLTTVDNDTKVLETSGTWLEDDITITDVSSHPSGTKNVSISTNGTTTEDVTNYANVIITTAVPASAVDTGTKSITANGNGQDVIGYASVNVNVPNSYTASDEGKVVSNGALVAQTSDTVTANNTYDTTLINSLTVNVSGGNIGGLANMVDVNTQNYQLAYMLMCMKKGNTVGGTITFTSAFPNTETLLLSTGLTTLHGFMFAATSMDFSVNGGGTQSNKMLLCFINTNDRYHLIGMPSNTTSGSVSATYGTQGTAQNGQPTQGTLRFSGGNIYYTGRYNRNANYQILQTNKEFEWLAW